MKCIGCGTELGAGDRFCGECGLPRSGAQAPSSSILPKVAPPPAPSAAAGDLAAATGPAAIRSEIRRFVGHSAAVIKLAFSVDGSRLFSADGDGIIGTWEVASGRSVAESRHKHARAIDFSSDRREALLAFGGVLARIDLASGEVHARHRFEQSIQALAFHPDGRRALVSTDDGLRLVDLESGRELGRFGGHREPAEFLVCSADGTRAISGRFDPDVADDGVLVWDLRSSIRVAAHAVGLASSAAFASDGRHAVVGALDGQAYLIDVEAGKRVRTIDAGGANVWCVACSPVGGMFVLGAGTDELDADTMAALGQPNNDLLVWSTAHDRPVGRLGGADRDVRSVAVSPDGRLVAAGTNGHTVHLWSLS